MKASAMNPPPEYESKLPLPSQEDIYDPFVTTADAVSPTEAIERVYPDHIDLKGLNYEQQTRLKFRLEAGPGRNTSHPPTDHAPTHWDGTVTGITFAMWGARTGVTYEWTGGENTSAYKPVPNHGNPNGYTLSGLALLVEFYDIDPIAMGELDLELPVPVIQPFDEGVYSIDWTTMREYFCELVQWSDNDDIYIGHEPWNPTRPRVEGTLEEIYDRRLQNQWVSLNPKYRGEFKPSEY